MSSQLNRFENARWEKDDQQDQFRHMQALRWLSMDDAPILDVGCGDGLLLEQLKKQYLESFGVDISDVAVHKCTMKGLEAERMDFSNGLLPARKFNTAILLDVLEHMLDPKPLLDALHERCDRLIISVPNFSSLPARLQVLFGKVPENNKPRKGHVYWYTLFVLRKTMQASGWAIDQIEINTMKRSTFCGKLLYIFSSWFPSLCALSFLVSVKRKETNL